MALRITWANVEGLKRFEHAIDNLGSGKLADAANKAVNRAGDMARTKVRQTLPRQTGLKRAVILKAVRSTASSAGALTYRMKSEGGDIALKFFGARETRRGVAAAPFGKRKVFAGDFMKGGRFPNRQDIGMGGQVFHRAGGSRFPLVKEKSGVIIPKEMVSGETAKAFEATVQDVLPRRMEHELRRLTKGVVG
ncbi:phage tail protein [Aureimonas sp. AU40]|uniref:phage tail protein n=1 Tax=Aureimonas sp. AU40 TaxID=1637747 RepID=UPI000ACBA1E2|nr:phage tail protein [Aureimonas sp. AU40]